MKAKGTVEGMPAEKFLELNRLRKEIHDSRRRETWLQRRLDAAEKLITTLSVGIMDLKKKGFTADPAVTKRPTPEVSRKLRPDEQIVRDKEAEVLDRMEKDFIRQGISPGAAKKEARRIRQEVTGTTMHPGG
jgi:hypothetical protein